MFVKASGVALIAIKKHVSFWRILCWAADVCTSQVSGLIDTQINFHKMIFTDIKSNSTYFNVEAMICARNQNSDYQNLNAQ